MFTRLRLFSAFALICFCANAMAVTGSTTFVSGYGPGISEGFSVDGCFGDNFGSVATPLLSDGKKICSLVEEDQDPLADNLLILTIDGFTSDPGSNYFNTLSLPCSIIFPSAAGYYYYSPATAGASGQASWTFDLYSTDCIYNAVGGTFSLSID
jgi:hypothetical protein